MSKSMLPGDGPDSGRGQFLVYESEGGQIKIDVRLEEEAVWLTQQLMADLFQTTKQNVSLHIQSIYEEGELTPEATVKKYLTVRFEGNREVMEGCSFRYYSKGLTKQLENCLVQETTRYPCFLNDSLATDSQRWSENV